MADETHGNADRQGPWPFTNQELAAISQEVSSYFPQPFELSDLCLLVIDPHNIHAYWHVRADDMARARTAAGAPDAPLVLRLYDITYIDFSRTQAHGFFDVQVHGLQSNWYIHLWEPAKSYVADIGLRRPDGSLVALARSNVIETPRAGQSPVYSRAGIALGPGGAAQPVPDLTSAPAQSDGPMPRPAMPRDEVQRLLSRFYRPSRPDGGRR